MPTLTQHACFDCRKVFKKPSTYQAGVECFTCPECGKEMASMGYKFRAPKKNDIKEWRRIEEAEENGVDWTTRTIRKEEKIEPPKLSREMKYALGIRKSR